MTLVVLGDSLLDRDVHGDVERLCPDAPAVVLEASREHRRAGGAALAATLARSHGHAVTLITALGGSAGAEVRELVEAAGVHVIDLGMAGATPEKMRLRAGDRTLMRLDRAPGPALDLGPVGLEARTALAEAAAVLVSDYGGGLTAHPPVRRALNRAVAGCAVVWDPHPRGAAPVEHVRLATPNRGEARSLVPDVPAAGLRGDAERARVLRRRWGCEAVAVTLGESGALLEAGCAAPTVVPAPVGGAGDTCGAGDRFAASAAVRLMTGAGPEHAVAGAVADATAYVLGGGVLSGTSPRGAPGEPGTMAHALAVAERVRSRSGVVVATGGCFDLLHAGHLATLEAARRLGDCLIVLINSDRSVGELKGPGRPVVGERDRARLLGGLGCVDAVAVFDAPTPVPALEALRPAVFAKGGDYRDVELPEAEVMRRIGGQTVILPTVEGHSTSSLIDRAVSLSVVA